VESSPDLVRACNEHIDYFVNDSNLSEAQNLFNLMMEKEVEPDVYTFTMLMKGYSEVGNTQRVSQLFTEMKEKGVEPTEVTFNTAIQACASTGDLEEAQSFFKKMNDGYGLEPDMYTYSSMLKVCATARDLETARSLIAEMNASGIAQDRVAMNTMIDVYAECCNRKNGKEYLAECREMIEDMKGVEVTADRQTYNTLLKLCSRGRLIAEAMKILEEMECNGIQPNVFSYSTVLDGISKDKTLSNQDLIGLASKILDEVKKKKPRHSNLNITNSLLRINLRVGDLNRAVRQFKKMKAINVQPSVATYRGMIECYEKLGNPRNREAYLKPCLDLLEECEQTGMNLSVQGFNSLLNACAKASDLDQALIIWNKMISTGKRPTVSSYNAMINVCVRAKNMDKAVSFFNEVKTEGNHPDSVTYATMIKCHAKLGDPKEGEAYMRPCLDLLDECEQAGIEMGIQGYISLLSACAKTSNLDQALKIWNGMMENKVRPTAFAFNAMINVCLSKDNEDMAFDFVDQMKTSGIKVDLVACRTFLAYFLKKKDTAGAEKICDEMKVHELKPNRVVLRMLKALNVEYF